MSLSRTALRLATIVALTRNFSTPYPTIAADRVFDSKIDPLQIEKDKDAKPTIIVYTDDDNGDATSNNNGWPGSPLRRHVNLVIEITIGAVEKLEKEDGYIWQVPPTDAELEAVLDLLEHQIKFVFGDLSSPWTVLLLNRCLLRVQEWNSARMVTGEAKLRLAGRQITARVEIKDDELPIQVLQAGETAAELPPDIQALLDAVGEGGGHVNPLITMLKQAGVPTAVTLPALKRVHFTLDQFGDTAGDTVGGPDVEASVEDLWPEAPDADTIGG